ncbi:hypothetical protein LRP31_09150 [Mesorhizobium mediterraneum]|uniref:ATPase n=1 Tax=Mesorhizobium mediterraneum TaxID=43617 RepID=A0AB36R4U1_9HYPH|nr:MULTISPECIES: Qat anti-phage system QueC-like protein QatC [Mesorhizobium]PAP99797.1 hypothetical protein CIT25_23325 [Mesorhizobium mediterraneum]RUU97520.1 hypothetical protein EOB36_26570 [Mesorhizobium sp. M6A.T.Cr.TU.017.01.1.1]RWN28459.1 MAG: hypothetical protein EOR96_32650 [Mesorhizobium sp.]WIW55372.1 hypothetical protein LRP31_09150 [Mesorhizobium mediterraneum]
MRRFVFVGRLGAADNGAVPVVQPDATPVTVQFVAANKRLDYGIGNALQTLADLGLRPTETAIDLVILAAMVNAADTRVSRSANAQDGWTRELDLVVPVREPDLWAAQGALLARTLRFLTGDHWRIVFRARPAPFATIATARPSLGLAEPDEVCLFSGGLDSLVGALDFLAGGGKPLLVSHYWDSETSKAQTLLLDLLRKNYKTNEPLSLRARLGFDRNHVDTGEVENSQRGRSFLFFALAILAASGLTSDAPVRVPENGLIGLNVPLDPLRLGSLSTRTTHPFYMARFNELMRGLGIARRLENPYRHVTKGQMVRDCEDPALLRRAIPSSMSCSSPAKARYRGLPPQHCGTCVPCLIRRASLAAGLDANESDTTPYVVKDLAARRLDTLEAEGEHVRSFQLMAERLRRNPRAAKALARIPGPLTDEPSEIDDYVDVFVRGMQEVAHFLEPVRAKPS